MNGGYSFKPSFIEHDFDAADDDVRFREKSSHLEKFYEDDADESESYVREITDAPSELFLVFFMLMSCGYMLPWTSLGSLITYYKETFSADFYVKLYCAYYLPGLPVALIQYRYDVFLDLKYGSQNMYLIRGIVPFAVMILILISLVWLKSEEALISLFVGLGICVSLCHGTASMLASMYPPSAIAYLQTGFRCPEIYTLIAVSILHLGKDALISNLNLFYLITSGVVFVGAVTWTYIVMDEKSKNIFDLKDNRFHHFNSQERTPLLGGKLKSANGNNPLFEGELNRIGKYDKSILQIVIDDDFEDDENDPVPVPVLISSTVLNTDPTFHHKNTSSIKSINNMNNHESINNIKNYVGFINNGDSEEDGELSLSNTSSIPIKEKMREIVNGNNVRIHMDRNSNKKETMSRAMISDENENENENENNFMYGRPPIKQSALSKFSSYANSLAHNRNLLERVEKAALLLQSRPNDEYAMNEEIFRKVFPLCLALFVTMWCSIFQASFFAYVTSSNGRDIERILYFVRLFSDLIGRPLTRFSRPSFLKVRI